MLQSVLQAGGSGPIKPEEWTDKAVHLTDDNVSELPNWTFIALYLQGSFELTLIPPMFFHRMALLQVLDLSHTSIKSLPKSLPKLVALKKLLLRGCQLFMVLPSLVGKLENLEELDLDETQIMDLPKDIGKLIKLSHLRLSFYHICGKNRSKSSMLIYPETLSILSKLTELSIDVNPEDKRWDDSVEAVVKEVCKSETLRTLSLYLPKFQLLDHISLMYPLLSRFSFTVGSHKRRIISRVPYEVEAEFRKWDKCLKFVNGENIPIEIRRVLKYCSSFFLDKHATAMSLSEFGIENVKRLKFCLLAECNKMETIIDGDDQSESGSVEHVLESLEYFIIYYMENLWSIWGGPNRYGCMSKLKFLALHTCPQLNNIFSQALLENFVNLEQIILEDCPRVTSLVSHGSVKPTMADKIFLPSLKRLLLLYLPELVSISNGILIAPELESIGFYNCPKLKSISKRELSSKNLKIIKGECRWWEDVNWNETEWRNRPDYLMRIFSPISNDKDVMTQLLAEVTDLFEATIKTEEQQLDDEMLLEVSTQDKKGETDQWMDYTEETKSGTDMSHATESKPSVSILPSNALLSTSEKTREWEQRNLISELRQGRKLVRQLLLHLNLDSSVEILAHRIEISYEKALSMLRSNTSLALEEKPSELAAKVSESPPPPVGSTPWSEDYDCTLREGMPKKRKTLPRWTERVQVTSDTALEGPLDDCYSWRKYGQKDILGSKYPSMEGILERYERYSYAERQLSANETEQNGSWTLEHARLKARMEVLQRNQRHYMGQDTENLSLRELQNLEQQLESALKHTRSRKNQLLSESISELQRKEKALQEETNMLAKKVKEKEKAVVQQTQWKQQNNCQDSSSMLLPQRVQTFNIGGTYEARSSGRDEESNPAQEGMANALLPALMVRHLE